MNEHLHPAERRAINAITYLMAKHDLSTAELSGIMKLAGSFEAKNILEGRRELRFVELVRLAEHLKLPVDYFLKTDDLTKLPDTLGGFLRQRRAELGLTQPQLADLVGISRQSYARMENKGGGMKPRFINPMAEALGVTVNTLSRYLNRKD